jgi:hypothetical protein
MSVHFDPVRAYHEILPQLRAHDLLCEAEQHLVGEPLQKLRDTKASLHSILTNDAAVAELRELAKSPVAPVVQHVQEATPITAAKKGAAKKATKKAAKKAPFKF